MRTARTYNLQHLLSPVRRLLVVNGMRRAERFRERQLLVRRRRGNDGRARRDRELQAEDRHATGTLDEHGVAAFQWGWAVKRVVGSDRRASALRRWSVSAYHKRALTLQMLHVREGRRFLITEVFWDMHEYVRGQHLVFGQGPINDPAESRGHGLLRDIAKRIVHRRC